MASGRLRVKEKEREWLSVEKREQHILWLSCNGKNGWCGSDSSYGIDGSNGYLMVVMVLRVALAILPLGDFG